ncbi:MAG: hypothetical protein HYW23_01285 [Candidatus Aenigmarchaeota archaeon]|nr:hypothetical protein [Candidatus Aenigmarchaeota archaeon]
MIYTSQRVQIPRTNDIDVAYALAFLAGFQDASFKRRCETGKLGRAILAFHKDTIARDPDLYLATQNPDIEVRREPEDVYIIEVSDKVDPSLIEKIPDEIRLAYSEREGTG